MSADCITFSVFHGTDKKIYNFVKKQNFSSSIGDNHWLGEGIYFFAEGISSSAKNDAKNWSIASSWDNKAKKRKYNQFCVISANIHCNLSDFWDLSSDMGLQEFNYARDEIIKKVSIKYKLPSNVEYKDSDIINLVCDKLKYLVIKSNFYIKFEKERIANIRSRIPNTTVINARSNSVIIPESIDLILEGDIE